MFRAFIRGSLIGAACCACIVIVMWCVTRRVEVFNVVFFGTGLIVSNGLQAMNMRRSEEERGTDAPAD